MQDRCTYSESGSRGSTGHAQQELHPLLLMDEVCHLLECIVKGVRGQLDAPASIVLL